MSLHNGPNGGLNHSNHIGEAGAAAAGASAGPAGDGPAGVIKEEVGGATGGQSNGGKGAQILDRKRLQVRKDKLTLFL